MSRTISDHGAKTNFIADGEGRQSPIVKLFIDTDPAAFRKRNRRTNLKATTMTDNEHTVEALPAERAVEILKENRVIRNR